MDQDGSGREGTKIAGRAAPHGVDDFWQVSLRRKNWKSYSQSLVWPVPQVERTFFGLCPPKKRALLQTNCIFPPLEIWVRIFVSTAKDPDAENLDSLFEVLDTDKDGFINFEEFVDFVFSTGDKEFLTEADLEKVRQISERRNEFSGKDSKEKDESDKSKEKPDTLPLCCKFLRSLSCGQFMSDGLRLPNLGP